MNYLIGDALTIELPAHSFQLIYADPPYAGCRFKYARFNKSRQWGRNARADFMRELIARMESLRADDGACAVSMATPELRLLHLFPSTARVCAWTKNWAQFRPGVWPTFAWEPVVIWGQRANFRDLGVRELGHTRPGGVPFDWTEIAPAPNRHRLHETPKPSGFGDWIIDITRGPNIGTVCELFAGTAPIATAAEARGWAATAIDLDDSYRLPGLD